MENRSGKYIRILSGEMAYSSFKPAPLPPNPPVEINDRILHELLEANRKVAYLDGLSSKIPGINLFVWNRIVGMIVCLAGLGLISMK